MDFIKKDEVYFFFEKDLTIQRKNAVFLRAMFAKRPLESEVCFTRKSAV